MVVLLLDCARADHFGCYGHTPPATPNIDRIATESALFEQAISPSIWTLESVASLFTGLYPTQHGAHYGAPTLDPALPTLAAWLRDLGYETRSATRNPWIVPETGMTRGFDAALDLRAAARLGPLTRLARRSLAAGLPLGSLRALWRKINAEIEERMDDAGAAQINQSTASWLATRDSSRPFFLFIDYMESHGPYKAPPADRMRFLPRGVDSGRVSRVPLQSWVYHMDPTLLTPANTAIIDALYSGALRYLDRMVGELVELLRMRGILDDTLLVISADHGENLGNHGMVGHNYCVYDSLAHVPLICRYPRVFEPGSRVAGTVQNIDLLPTIEALLGTSAPAPPAGARSGISLHRAARGDGRRDGALIEYLEPNLDLIRTRFPHADLSSIDCAWRALRDERWKLVLASDGRAELYDIEQDSGETNDLSAIHPAIVEAMCRRLDERLDELGGDTQERWSRQAAERSDLSAQMRERLAAFGYL